jgi:hypothetical protein
VAGLKPVAAPLGHPIEHKNTEPGLPIQFQEFTGTTSPAGVP